MAVKRTVVVRIVCVGLHISNCIAENAVREGASRPMRCGRKCINKISNILSNANNEDSFSRLSNTVITSIEDCISHSVACPTKFPDLLIEEPAAARGNHAHDILNNEVSGRDLLECSQKAPIEKITVCFIQISRCILFPTTTSREA